MQSALSIVIPVLGDFEQFEQGLVSVLENRPAGAEVLAVFNGPYADPFSLGDEIGMLAARRGAGLAECIDLGWRQARGEVIHVIPAGAEVEEGWTDAARRRFTDPQVAAVVPLALDLERRQTILTAGIDYRPSGTRVERGRGWRHSEAGRLAQQPLGCSLTTGFWRRSALESVGGLALDLGDRADVDLALRLQQAGYQAAFEPQAIVAAPRSRRHASALTAGLHAERLFWRHTSAWRPLDLLKHALLGLGETLSIPWQPTLLWRLAGRAAGLIESPWRRRRIATPAQRPASDDAPITQRRAA